MDFPLTYPAILDMVEKIQPGKYAQTRNYTNGAVSQLSPYISRGVISTKQVLDSILSRGYSIYESEKFIQQLAWREYYQRTWQHYEDYIFDDIKINYSGVQNRKISQNILAAKTGINVIDQAINEMIGKGYIHNHLRMYIASIISNIARSYWKLPSEWMYYHLLDGDLANNTLSWQWIAGSFSSKQYYCNQENINKYANSSQQNTFLDKSYEELTTSEIPHSLKETATIHLTTNLPNRRNIKIDSTLPLLIYNSYNLDPLWRSDMKANRVLILEPSHFKQYPVSNKVIDFIIGLSKNIKDIQIFTGEINEIPFLKDIQVIYSKEHPAFKHLPGNKDKRDWLFPDIEGQHNSFFSYWKKCLRQLNKLNNNPQLKRA